MIKNNFDIDGRSFDFSVSIIKMVLGLPNNVASWKIGGQIIASATSVNSNIVQARAGVSRKDFINHMRISVKEAKETLRWLEMILAVGLSNKELINPLSKECNEIICILVAIIKKSIKEVD